MTTNQMTTDQRKIEQLTDRLIQVIVERDQLQRQLNQMQAGYGRIAQEIGLALDQVEQLAGEVAVTNSDKKKSG